MRHLIRFPRALDQSIKEEEGLKERLRQSLWIKVELSRSLFCLNRNRLNILNHL
jgi:hypothetical protein